MNLKPSPSTNPQGQGNEEETTVAGSTLSTHTHPQEDRQALKEVTVTTKKVKKDYRRTRYNNGLVLEAKRPDIGLLSSLIEPEASDPGFLALCREIEAATGIKIENNPQNENPTYLFDEPYSAAEISALRKKISSEGIMPSRPIAIARKKKVQNSVQKCQYDISLEKKSMIVDPPTLEVKAVIRAVKVKPKFEEEDQVDKKPSSDVKTSDDKYSESDAKGSDLKKNQEVKTSVSFNSCDRDKSVLSDASAIKILPCPDKNKNSKVETVEGNDKNSIQAKTLEEEQENGLEVESVVVSRKTSVKKSSVLVENKSVIVTLIEPPKKLMNVVNVNNVKKTKTLKEKDEVPNLAKTVEAEQRIDHGDVKTGRSNEEEKKKRQEMQTKFTKALDAGSRNSIALGDEAQETKTLKEKDEVSSLVRTVEVEQRIDHGDVKTGGASEEEQIKAHGDVKTVRSNEKKKREEVHTKFTKALDARSRNSIAIMKKELTKPNPDVKTLEDLMRSTFKVREKMINDHISIADLLDIFPALQFPEVISQEFFMRCNIRIDIIIEKLEPLFKRMMQKDDAGRLLQSTSHTVMKEAFDYFQEYKPSMSADQINKVRKNLGMLMFCTKKIGPIRDGILFSRLNADKSPEDQIPTLAPYILLREGNLAGATGSTTALDIYVEKCKVLTTNSFFDALLYMHMMYFIVWMEYEASTGSVFEAFEEMMK